MHAPVSKFYSARIVERRDISSDLWTIRVDPGGEFPFRAGQYATLVSSLLKNTTSAPTQSSPPRTKSIWSFSLNWYPTAR